MCIMSANGANVKLDPLFSGANESQCDRPSALVICICTVDAGATLSQVLSTIPGDSKASFLILTDVRRGFTTLLSERLRAETYLSIWPMELECTLASGEGYLVPAQSSCEFREIEPGGAVQAIEVPLVDDRAKESPVRLRETCRRAAEIFGNKSIAVFLSSLAGDTVEAVQEIKEAGGRVICQNESTSLVVDGPRMAVQSKLADDVLPLWAISGHLAEVLGTT